MIETADEWMARIGSSAAVEERQRLRASGEINYPLRGPRGLALLVSLMAKRKTWQEQPGQHEAALPLSHVVVAAKPAPKQAKSKWKQRGRPSN